MLDVQPPPDISSTVRQIARQFASPTMTVIATVNSAVADLAGLAYDSVPSVDILLHFTRTERRLRRSLIKGGAIFGILVGFVFPVIPKV